MSEAKSSHRQFTVAHDDVGRRLDRVARKFLAEQSLGTIFGAIRRGDIRVNSKRVTGGYRIRPDDRISIPSSITPPARPASVSDPPELPAWFTGAIVLENENILALDKPAGVLVHGQGSLERSVTRYLRPAGRSSLSFTPGPLHRLDRNTSGLVLFGKSIAGATRFTSLLRSRSVRKEYLALLEGRLPRTQTWSDRLERDRDARASRSSPNGRPVKCLVAPLCASEEATLALVTMESGFTHQIRAQAAANGHPLVGDKKYGARGRERHYLLHARAIRLSYFDPVLGFRGLVAPLPDSQSTRLETIYGRRLLERALGTA